MGEQQRSAEELAKKQRQISISEFFEKNRHLLGFDNPRKALLIGVKEACDNSLDACEEARILPEISVELIQLEENRFRMVVEDNGPGIVRAQIPNIFAKLLYGSKFHKLSSTRGQQGIGISATLLYGQLTTGRPATVISKTGAGRKAVYMKLKIDTSANKPEIVEEKEVDWEKEHGTKVEIEMEGSYQKGRQSVDEYLKETAIVNPHATIIYTTPEAQQIIFPRATEQMPAETKEIMPHPYGVELGRLIRMLEITQARTLQQFLTTEFVRVGPGTAKEICANAALLPNTKPESMSREMAENLFKGIQKTKIIAPPMDCISPIGEEQLERGLRKEINAEFYCATTRPPEVYRGNPFIIECCTGDSLLLLEDGTRLSIKEYVESDDGRKVLSLDENYKISITEIIAKQKFENVHKLLKIKTKTGRELTLTENNKVPVISDGMLVWKKTSEVSAGEYLAVPKVIPIEGITPSFLDLLEKKHIQVLNKELVRGIVEELRIKYGDLKIAARELKMSYNRFKSFRRFRCISRPSFVELEGMARNLKKDFLSVKEQITEIRYVDNHYYNPKKITLPPMNEDVLYILGLLESDGCIRKNMISFVNLDAGLHYLFKQKVEALFNISVKKYKTTSYFCNKTFYTLFTGLRKIVPTLPTVLIIAWLKGIVDGDGWVNLSKREIGIATAKKEEAQKVQTFLLRLGIISKIQRSKIPSTFGYIGERAIRTKQEKFNIIITGHSHVSKFKEIISFRQSHRAQKLSEIDLSYEARDTGEVFPVGDLLRIFRGENRLFQTELGFSDMSIRQVEKNRQNITSHHLQQMVSQKEYVGEAYLKLLKLATSDIICDKIIDVQLMPHEEYVYDLTTTNGNFIANNIIMHNCALAYGGEQPAEDTIRILRFANRVPLLYQQGACAITSVIQNTVWRPYGLNQSTGSLPTGPCTFVVHMTSVWVPFTSESKEALAHYPEIMKEVKLAMQEVGRKLASFVNKKRRIGDEAKKRSYIEKYIPHVAMALQEILKLSDEQKKKIEEDLAKVLEHTRGELEDIGVDNPEYDEALAKIGAEEEYKEPWEQDEDGESEKKKKEKQKKLTDDEDEEGKEE